MGFLLCDGMQLMYWVKREKSSGIIRKNERAENTSELLNDGRQMVLQCVVFDRHQPFHITCFYKANILFCTIYMAQFSLVAANRIIQVCITLAHFVWSVGVLKEKRTEVYAYKTICLAHFNEFVCLLPITLFIDSVHGLSNMFVSTFIILITIQIFIL